MVVLGVIVMFVIVFLICLLNVQDDSNKGIIYHLGMALSGAIYFYFIFYSIAILSTFAVILLAKFLGIPLGSGADGFSFWGLAFFTGFPLGFIVAFKETMKKLKGKNNNNNNDNNNNNASNTNPDNNLSSNNNASLESPDNNLSSNNNVSFETPDNNLSNNSNANTNNIQSNDNN